MVKVLVTGGHGLVGHSLQKIAPHYIFLKRQDGDLRSAEDVHTIFQQHRPDVVIHLASHVGGVYDNMKHNYTYLMDNLKIHCNVVDACRTFHVKKLINILSTCIFPDEGVTYPLTSPQMHHGLPHSSNIGYAYSKRVLHIASSILAETSSNNIHVVNLTPTNLYGEYDQYNLEKAHVIPALIHKTYLAKRDLTAVEIRGSGEAKRQFVFSDDFARVILHFVERDYDHQVSCIVSPDVSSEISIKDLIHEIARLFDVNNKSIVFHRHDEEGQLQKTTDDHELRQYLPDFAFTSLKDGLSVVVDHFQKHYSDVRKD